MREWVQRHPGYHAQQYQRRKLTGETKASSRKQHLARRGVSEELFAEMLLMQGGRCAVCGGLPHGQKRRFHIDHDHACCQWGCDRCRRGLLCHGCNAGSGLTDDPRLLRAKAAYLDMYA